MKKRKSLLCLLLVVLMVLLNFSLFSTPSKAATGITYEMIKNQWFYIKNAYSGRYLDVSGGIAADGTNVAQYEFNGTDSQMWFLFYKGDGLFQIGSKVGMTVDNGQAYVNFALDVKGGDNGNNEVNIQIWHANNTDAQKFKIGLSPKANNTVAFMTGPSGYNKAMTVQGRSCSNNGNVFQYSYNKSANDEWILEPVAENIELGVAYAHTNYEKYVECYPKLTNFNGYTADCANFVSQSILSSGKQHYNGNWKVYRKNGTYSQPANTSQLDTSWDLCAPSTSPWTSAKEFANFWKSRRLTYIKGSDIIGNKKNEVWQLSINRGDVIQYAEIGAFNMLGSAEHTMYVTGLDFANNTYLLTYHSNPKKDEKLEDIARQSQNKYFIFYSM